MKNDADRNNVRKIRVTSSKGDVEINWPKNQQLGFCPHCHKRIPPEFYCI
jgi:RNase P subunit RPR2